MKFPQEVDFDIEGTSCNGGTVLILEQDILPNFDITLPVVDPDDPDSTLITENNLKKYSCFIAYICKWQEYPINK